MRYVVIPGNHLPDRSITAGSAVEAVSLYEQHRKVKLDGEWESEDRGDYIVLRRKEIPLEMAEEPPIPLTLEE